MLNKNVINVLCVLSLAMILVSLPDSGRNVSIQITENVFCTFSVRKSVTKSFIYNPLLKNQFIRKKTFLGMSFKDIFY